MDAVFSKMKRRAHDPDLTPWKKQKARVAMDNIIDNTTAQKVRSAAAAIEKLPNKLPKKPGFKQDTSKPPGPVKNFIHDRVSTAKKNLKALGLGGESASASTGPKNFSEVVKSPATRRSKNIVRSEDSYTQAEVRAINKQHNEHLQRMDDGMPAKRPPVTGSSRPRLRPKSKPGS